MGLGAAGLVPHPLSANARVPGSPTWRLPSPRFHLAHAGSGASGSRWPWLGVTAPWPPWRPLESHSHEAFLDQLPRGNERTATSRRPAPCGPAALPVRSPLLPSPTSRARPRAAPLHGSRDSAALVHRLRALFQSRRCGEARLLGVGAGGCPVPFPGWGQGYTMRVGVVSSGSHGPDSGRIRPPEAQAPSGSFFRLQGDRRAAASPGRRGTCVSLLKLLGV